MIYVYVKYFLFNLITLNVCKSRIKEEMCLVNPLKYTYIMTIPVIVTNKFEFDLILKTRKLRNIISYRTMWTPTYSTFKYKLWGNAKCKIQGLVVCNVLWYFVTVFMLSSFMSGGEVVSWLCRGGVTSRKHNFDHFKPHFYIIKQGLTGVSIIFLISAKNIACGYSLEPPYLKTL